MLSRVAKPSQFTKFLSPDSKISTIQQAESAPAELLRKARTVDGSFTWVPPETRPSYELQWISTAAARDLKLDVDLNDAETAAVLSGQTVVKNVDAGVYPFAQNYAGDQFGSWAGQLGDGRAITLFSVGGYELQLKGAGKTPYSRFGDGKAVLRSSIREALVSEYLHQLGIPTQRCLSVATLPGTMARRERMEQCAVIARMAPSWIRIGTFQLHDSRQNREELRKLADYCINVLKLGSEMPEFPKSDPKLVGNRYFALFRDASLRNARMMAQCQAYGFLNGVLNTDNVSVLGFSLDYGPFAFMDTFSATYTPNHDDWTQRYGFQNAPVMMWWNCVKLAECLAELIAAQDHVDDLEFVAHGIKSSQIESAREYATQLILRVGEEFQTVYESEYHELMMSRLGLTTNDDVAGDRDFLEHLLRVMQDCELDYNRFFRKLSKTQSPADFLPHARVAKSSLSDEDVIHQVGVFLEAYKNRLAQDTTVNRQELMDKTNPNFLLRNSVLSNIIDLAETGSWEAFQVAAKMALNPFAENWPDLDPVFVKRYTNDRIEVGARDSQLSCSS